MGANGFSPRNQRRSWSAAWLLALSACALACAAENTPAPLGEFAKQIDGFETPTAAAIAADGTIYVVERDDDCVTILSADGERIGRLGPEIAVEAPVPGLHEAGPTRLLAPEGVAVTADGRVYVADTGNHRVCVLAPDGKLERVIGGFGGRAGQFNRPRGLAVDAQRLYVADTGNHRIQVLSRDGGDARTFGGYGFVRGRFCRPHDVAVDGDGRLLVADSGGSRIQLLSADGEPVKRWGAWGSFAGLLAEPRGVAFHVGPGSERAQIYVADTRNHRVQVFEPNGEVVYQWGLHAIRPREGRGKLHYPDSVSVSPDGTFAVVCESFENRIQIFRRGQIEQSLIPPPSSDAGGAAHYGERMAADGGLLALTEPDAQSVMVYDFRGEIPILITTIGGHGPRAGHFIHPTDVHLDARSRRLLVINSGLRRLDEFELDWDPDAEIGFNPTLSRYVRGIDLNVLVAKAPPTEGGVEADIVAVERDADGWLYLLDQSGCRVLVFEAGLEFVRSLGGRGARRDGLLRPTDLALGAGGAVYVVDELRCNVFRLDGERVEPVLLAEAGGQDARVPPPMDSDGPLDADVALLRPFGLCVHPSGVMLVTDARSDRVLVLRSDAEQPADAGERGRPARPPAMRDDHVEPVGAETGSAAQAESSLRAATGRERWKRVAQFGGRGLEAGRFRRPTAAAIDAHGRWIVLDYGNHRGQVFDADGRFLRAFGARLFVQPTRTGRP